MTPSHLYRFLFTFSFLQAVLAGIINGPLPVQPEAFLG
jgi:hypothetical protein